MVRQNSLRVLEDYELDHVSGGFDSEADFYAEPFNVPDGFTLENISGAILQQDLATGEWTVELVFESDFTEAGYASSDTPYDGGGGIMPIMPAEQGVLDGDTGALSAGGQRTTTQTRVTTTKTSPTSSFSINFGFFKYNFQGGQTTTTTTTITTTTTSAGRITSQGKTGRLPSK